MSDEAALWAAVVADPADDTLRLAYADWLDERGDPRAAWFRSAAVWHYAKYHPAEVLNRVRPDAPPPVTQMLAGISDEQPVSDSFLFSTLLSALGSALVPHIRGWAAEEPLARFRRLAGLLDFLQAFPPPDLAPVPELVRRVRRGGWFEQWLAVIDLGHHGPAAAKAVPALLRMRRYKVWDTADELYHDGRGHPWLLAYYHTLGCIGPAAAAAAPELASAGWFNAAAYEALREIRPDPLLVLAHINDDDDGDTRSGLYVVIDLDPTRTGALLHAVRHHTGRKRWYAAVLLGEMGRDAEHALPALGAVRESLGDVWDRDEAEGFIRDAIDRIRAACEGRAPGNTPSDADA